LSKRKKRKKPYIPGAAALQFKVQFDWEIEEANELYENALFEVEVDRILYEDCIEGMERLPEKFVDLIVADPPFGIKFDGKGSQYNRNSNLVVDGYEEIIQDYDNFSYNWISKISRIMKDTASAFIVSGWTNLKDILFAIDKSKLEIINHIIWKYQFGVFTKKKFVTSHYHILFVAKNPKKYFFNKIEHYPLDIWDIPRTYRPGQKKNSTKLPETLVMRCIDFCSKPGDLIFDPFMGNGTTAVSAKAKFRHFLGFEINEKMKPILESNINNTKTGEFYHPYRTYLPDVKEILEKYPHLKKFNKKIPNKKSTIKQKKLDFTANV